MIALLLSIVLQTVPVATEAPHELYQRGIELLDQGQWSDALPVYQQITRTNPTSGWGWMGLGWSLHYTGDCRAALPAYARALELGGLQPYRVMHEMARCQVALGDHAAAIALVGRALDAGFPVSDRLRLDRALEPLHAQAAFRDLFAPAVTAPAAPDRVAGWHADLDLAAREIARIHHSARNLPSGALASSINALKQRASSSTDHQMTVGLMALLRTFGDGHTYVEPRFMQPVAERAELPLRFGYFEEGVFITAVAPGDEDMLWARVARIEDVSAADVFARVAAIVPQDNAWRPRAVVPDYLLYPQLLNGLGLSASADRLAMTIVDRAGMEREVSVATRAGAMPAWVRAPDGARVPAYVVRRRDWYWFEPFPGTRTMFVQYNACANKENESVAAFSERLSKALEGDIDRVIVDLRWNGGGNNFVNRPLLEAITRATQNRRGQLFVLTGPETFSAAMIFAAQLERYTHAIFVGEPTGSSPNFVGETTFVALPNTGIRLSLSNLYWQTSHATDFRPWIPPLVYVPARFADYRAGRDAVVDAVMAYPRR